jgi:Mrp family chromosome partitioning ATPase
VLAVAIPVLMDRLDHTIRDPRVAARALSAPVLSTIPASLAGNRTRLAAPGSEREGAYRRLAAASIATDQLPRAIVVTSPVGHMQDSVAANFAAALAGLGLRVALVATDPGQAWYSEQTEEAFTLPDYLATASADRLNGHIRDRMMPTPIENLRVVPHGITGVDELLDGLPALLDAFADAEIDVTVIAGPPMLEESSTTILAWSTRSVLWVVEAGEVTEQEARDAAERLALAGATPFGVAVVDGIG